MRKEISYIQSFSYDFIMNAQIMANIGGGMERVHEKTLIFSGISKHMDNYYGLDNLVSDRLMFTYKSYGEICSENKSNFLSGDEIIEDHWVKENIIASRSPLALDDLEMRM